MSLSPVQAAEAASTVYGIQQGGNVADEFRFANYLKEDFDFGSGAQRLTARTGAMGYKINSGFVATAMGKSDLFKRHALIVCRGTASLADTLTDLNTGIQFTDSADMVHAGFNRTFNDLKLHISNFINSYKPDVVHCVGHSLGGALATLAADLVISKSCHAELYTFGCPRVGGIGFAKRLSESAFLGKDKIHRVYHSGDPVAMVPLWPFVHAPQPGGECYIQKMLNFNPAQHKMNNYLDSVKKSDWAALRKPQPTMQLHIKNWLDSAEKNANLGFNFYNLQMISAAIKLLTESVIKAGCTLAGIGLVGGVTLLDNLSYALERSSKLSTENEGMVKALMIRILKICGVSYMQTTNLTVALISFVLKVLVSAIAAPVRLALSTHQQPSAT